MSEMFFADRLPLKGVQRHEDGYLYATVKVARTGVYLYTGDEVGRPDVDVVRVYRPLDEVFEVAALGSFNGKPITDGHPGTRVTAKNWEDYAKGHIKRVARDGEEVTVDIAIMSDKLSEKVEDGTARQLSPGYLARLDWTSGVTEDGQEYDACQRDIYVDHLAVVPEARGGSNLRIGDGAGASVVYPLENPGNSNPAKRAKKEDPMSDALNKTVTVDNRSVVTDAAGEVILSGLLDSMKSVQDKNAELASKVSDQTKALETKDGEIAALKKDLDDAKMTPAKLNALVVSRDATMKKAEAMGVDKDDMEDMDEADMKKTAIQKKMGDEAKDWSEDQIAGAFAMASVSDQKPKAKPGEKQLGDGIKTTDSKGVFSDAVLKAAGVKLKKEAA